MIPIPAIDIKNKKVVRLSQGKFDQEKIYDQDPVLVAQKWATEGAKLIHIVDLDGARDGKPQNLDSVKKIHEATGVPVQLGGGLRDFESITKAFAAGVTRVVLGTRVIENIDFLKIALKQWDVRIAVSLDCASGFVATKGWTKISEIKADELIPKLERVGLKTLVLTDIATDGMLKGPNLKSLKHVLALTSMKVVAAGGISTLEDIRNLLKIKADNLDGVIIGKALYEHKFSLREAIHLCSKKE